MWQCDKFPVWLEKTYRIKGRDFCKDQWNGALFNSQPRCNDKVLPTVSFYDRRNQDRTNENQTQPLCTINMNEMDSADEFDKRCNDVVSILNSNKGKV